MMRELFLRDLSLWDYLWQSMVFLALGLAAGWWLRRRPSRAYAALLLAMMAAVLVPFLSAVVRHGHLGVFPAEPPRPAHVPLDPPEPMPQNTGTPPGLDASPATASTGPRQDSTSKTTISWQAILLSAWLAATLLLVARLVAVFVYGARLARQAQGTGCEGIQEAAARTASRLRLAHGLQIRASDRIHSPVVWCWTRPPILLVPRAPACPEVEWTGVVTHELAHCKRRDHLTGLLAELATSVLPWNPLMWVARRFLIRLGEQACDDWVIASGQSSEDYAESLLRFRPQRQMAFWPTVVSSQSGLGHRIRRILNDACGNPRPGLKWAATLSIAATGIGLGVAFAQTRPAQSETPAQLEEKSASSRPQMAAAAHLGDLLRTFQDPNAQGNSWFGYSLATVGNNVLVGAPVNRAAYVFDGSTAKLLRAFASPPTAKGRIFGWCVAAAGNHMVVADPGENTDGEGSGRVYLFNGSTGDLLHTFVNPKPAVYRNFGQAVAGMGDNRIVIGATCRDVRADGAGAVFLFDASTGKMLQVFQKPKRATTANPLHACIAALGEDVLVGATEDDTGAERAGSVYMFDGSTGKLVRTFQNPAPTVGDYFGNWIAAAGNSVLIGASDVCMFDRGTGRLLRTFPNPAPRQAGERSQGDVFGRCVAFVGNNVLIGVSGDDTGAENAGAAYLFEGTTGKILHKFVNPNPIADTHFGVQVAALGNDILIATRPTRGASPGAVYLFKGVD